MNLFKSFIFIFIDVKYLCISLWVNGNYKCVCLSNHIGLLLSIGATWALVCSEFFFRFSSGSVPTIASSPVFIMLFAENRRKRKVIFIENCAAITNEKVLCGIRNFRSPTHLSLPWIELSKNETEKIKYLRFIIKRYLTSPQIINTFNLF